MTSEEVFQKFIPEKAVNYCNRLYERLGFEFKVKRARQTKFGDYRYHPDNGKHAISINNDLNPYAFLITYIHEVAHLVAYKEYGLSIKPHGTEWKKTFKNLVKPILSDEVFPHPVLSALQHYFANPKASSCSDPKLYAILKQFNLSKKDQIFLKEISIGTIFKFNKKIFKKIEKKRTRSVCHEMASGRKYLISELAEVQPTKI